MFEKAYVEAAEWKRVGELAAPPAAKKTSPGAAYGEGCGPAGGRRQGLGRSQADS